MGKLTKIGLVVVVVAGLALAGWMAWRPARQSAGILEVNGRIEGDQAAVGAKVGGKIVRLAVREGDALKAGDLIAELASDQVQAELQRAEHALHTAREQLAEAQARLLSTQRQVEEAETAVTLAERESRARIGGAEAALGAARAQLRQAESLSGSVATGRARPGLHWSLTLEVSAHTSIRAAAS